MGLPNIGKPTLFNNALAKAGIAAKGAQRRVGALRKVRTVLDAGRPARAPLSSSREELAVPKPLFLLTLKPTMYVANAGQGAKEAGKLRLKGKDYAVRDGDLIHFRFNL